MEGTSKGSTQPHGGGRGYRRQKRSRERRAGGVAGDQRFFPEEVIHHLVETEAKSSRWTATHQTRNWRRR